MSTKMQVEWRRTKVLELLSEGDSQSDIAKTLQSRDKDRLEEEQEEEKEK
jgi:DNA-binding NarL/FixJ family response regulator